MRDFQDLSELSDKGSAGLLRDNRIAFFIF